MKARLSADKVKIRVPFEIPIDLHDEYKQFHDWKHSVSIGEFGKAWKIWKGQKAALTYISLPLQDGAHLLVEFGYSSGRHFAWFEFNPSKFSDAAFDELAAHLSLLLNHGGLSLLARGRFIYCELAIDVRGARFHDFLFLDPLLRSASNEYETLGTVYVGSRLGGRSFTCYDKAREVLKRSGVGLGHELLRIEAKLKASNSFEFADALAVKNPFSTLVVVDRKLFSASKNPCIESFRWFMSGSDVSIQEAYCALTKLEKKEIRNSLLELVPKWWQPDAIWSEFPGAMDWAGQLIPTYVPV